MAKILLVEDDKSLREIYGVRLMAEGYEIVSAGDGEEALAMAIKERPDLIVSDVMMPKISGFDMLDILRSTTETKDVKVIMMTALSSDDQRARGESLGADRYLVKSQVGIEDVVRTVHDVLGDGPVTAPIAAPAPVPAVTAPTVAAPTPPPAYIETPPASFNPAPVADTPAPVAAPLPQPSAPPAPIPAPTYTPIQAAPVAPTPDSSPYAAPPMPAAPAYTSEPLPQPTPPPVYQASPVTQPAPAAPTVLNELPANPAPVAAPAFAAPANEPSSMPQPTAPFSSPAPASLGERVIQPLSSPTEAGQPNDIASQIAQELNTQNTQGPGTPSAQ